MKATLLRGGTVLAVDMSDTALAGGWVPVRDGRITGTGSKATTPAARDLDVA